MAQSHPNREAQIQLTAWWAPIIIAIACVGATLISTIYIQRLADDDRASQERESVQKIYAHVSELFQEYTNALHMVAGFARASDLVSSEDWKAFLNESRLKQQHPGVLGFAYIERVEPHHTDGFIESMQAEGIEDFQIKSHPSSDNAPPEDPLYIVKYEEPESRNKPAWGLNAASDPVNKAVYDLAAEIGGPALSRPFRLIQQTGDVHLGAIMVAPLYERGMPVETIDQRRDHVRGWCAVVIDFQHFFACEIDPTWSSASINVAMSNTRGKPVDVYRSTPTWLDTTDDRTRRVTFPVTLAGDSIDLSIEVDPESIWSPHTAQAGVVLAVGLVGSFLLTTIVWLVTRSRAHACAIAERMTKELRERESAQRELAKRAQAANLAKSVFLANMSHEIRTPMSAILGYTDVLDDTTRSTDLSTEIREPIANIRRAGHHLLSIINDILDLSKIESGKNEIHPIPCAPRELAAQVVSTLRVRADQKRLHIDWSAHDSVPECLMLDEHRVSQILMNLLGNAIKFTDDGSIRLEITRDDHQLIFRVIDTGSGIAADSLESIFNPFEQADASMTRPHHGTGLGLTISRELAHQMDGTLTASSVLGEGAAFTLTLPLVIAQESERRDQDARNLPHHDTGPIRHTQSARVLVVEDGEDNQRLIEHYLSRAGHRAVFASNGREAIDIIDRDNAFDLIIMDMQMPVLDGYVATPELRTRGCTIPILALTAHAMEHDRQRCLDVGCDEYLSKPIDRAALHRTIDALLARRARDAA